MSYYGEIVVEDVVDNLRMYVTPDDDGSWTDPCGLLESISMELERLDFSHDPDKPFGKAHECTIWARGCETTRTCKCNGTGGNNHDEHEFNASLV